MLKYQTTFSASYHLLYLLFLLVTFALVIYGFGTGLFQSINSKSVMVTLPDRYLGIGSAMLSMIRWEA